MRVFSIFLKKGIGVVGGGDTACEEALFLTKYASHVHLFVRRSVLKASKIMSERILDHPKITIEWNTVPIEVKGNDSGLNTVVLKDTNTLKTREMECT
jgi:thioredoxin reductase (NADPH)